MTSQQYLKFFIAGLLLPLLAAGMILAPSARANVYATNVKLNGARADVSVVPNSPVTISYLLNEDASLGVTLKVLSGTNAVKTFTLSGGGVGTSRGTNTIVWNGQDETGTAVGLGEYRVSIAAMASGHTNWAELTAYNDDTKLYAANGIRVNRNTNSPYCGRVYIANADSFSPPTVDGYNVGIVIRNADGTAAEEGGLATGGYAWTGAGASPWKLSIAGDDNLYVADNTTGTLLMRWDPILSDGSRLDVLRSDNWTNGSVAGFAVTGSGTNVQIWAADTNSPSLGIVRWLLAPTGACATNDTGATIIGIGSGTNLSVGPYALATDGLGNVYTCQRVQDPADPAARVLCFGPNTSPTNSVASWAVGGGSDMFCGASGLAVDPTGTYLAASFEGYGSGLLVNGCLRVLYATNGILAADIDYGRMLEGSAFVDWHSDTDCDWDTAGNLYVIDNFVGCWRAFSPPGTNQFTTVAPQRLTVAVPAPAISSIFVASGNVTIRFTGQSTDIAGAFKLLSSAAVNGGYSEATDATISQVSPGVFTASVPTNGPARFYRVQKN